MADLIESGKLSAPAQLTGKSWDVRVIEGDRQGSSAYYPAKVLEEGAPLFTAGTKIYMNHPSKDDNFNRPERNANDIIGYFEEAARYNPNTKSLHQKAHIFESHREWVKERAEAGVIGMSIRAQGELSEADGKKTLVRFTKVDSVDLVTEAGAGGKFEMLLESAKPHSESEVSESKEKEESVMDPKLEEALDAVVADQAALKESVAAVLAALAPLAEFVTEAKTAAAKKEDAKDGGADDYEEDENGNIKKDANGKPIKKVKKAAAKESASPTEIADALIESGLPKAARAKVAAAVEAGAELAEAITAEKDYMASVLEAAGPAARFGHVADESARLSEAEELKKLSAIFS